MISPIRCTFRLPAEREMVALAINKAYTSNLMDMEKFPCFNAFDKYQVYDDHEIEDYTMYYIRALKSNDATAILFGSTYSRAYGYKLNRIDKRLFEILSFKRPSNLLEHTPRIKYRNCMTPNIFPKIPKSKSSMCC